MIRLFMVTDNKKLSRRTLIKTTGGLGIAGLAGCAGLSGPSNQTTSQETIKAAWVYLSETGDLGWTHAHDQGRQAVEEDLDFVTTSYTEAVPPSDARSTFEQYAQDDYDILFGTTFGYNDAMMNLSQEYNDLAWEHCNGIETGDNLGIFYGKMYQARYLAGVAAGMVTDSNTIGFIGTNPISHTIREINGFAAGVKHVNPDAEILVRWINAFFDPTKSKQATEALIDEGADVTAQLTDSPQTVETAANNDVWSVGSNSPMKEYGGEYYLTSGVWNWGVFYKSAIQAVANEEWEPDFDWPGISEEIVVLDDWGPNVPEEVKSEVETRRQQLVDGELSVWDETKFEDAGRQTLYFDMGTYIDNIKGSVPG
jgi:basic membrane protein A